MRETERGMRVKSKKTVRWEGSDTKQIAEWGWRMQKWGQNGESMQIADALNRQGYESHWMDGTRKQKIWKWLIWMAKIEHKHRKNLCSPPFCIAIENEFSSNWCPWMDVEEERENNDKDCRKICKPFCNLLLIKEWWQIWKVDFRLTRSQMDKWTGDGKKWPHSHGKECYAMLWMNEQDERTIFLNLLKINLKKVL